MKRIKLNIEIELEGKEAETFVKRLEQLSDALTGSATVSQQAKPLPSPTPKKAVKAPAPSPKPTKKAVKAPAPSPKPTKKHTASSVDFIRAWESSTGTAEVSQKLGISRSSVSSRASMLRASGVALKKFKAGRRKAN